MNYSELRRQGRESLSGKWAFAIGIMLLFAVLVFIGYAVVALPNVLISMLSENPQSGGIITIQVIISIALGVIYTSVVTGLALGILKIYLQLSRNEYTNVGELFAYIRKELLVKNFLLYLLLSIYRFLWTLLLIIPGIIKTFSYSMTFFILIDNPELSVNEAITRSRKMMDGHKFELFVLGLTFIGWYLLSAITFGIGFIWLIPYVQSTATHFYRKISGEQQPELV